MITLISKAREFTARFLKTCNQLSAILRLLFPSLVLPCKASTTCLELVPSSSAYFDCKSITLDPADFSFSDATVGFKCPRTKRYPCFELVSQETQATLAGEQALNTSESDCLSDLQCGRITRYKLRSEGRAIKTYGGQTRNHLEL